MRVARHSTRIQVRTPEFREESTQIRRPAVNPHVHTWLLRHGICPGKVIVRKNAEATADNIPSYETFFRLGIVGELIGFPVFVFVAQAL